MALHCDSSVQSHADLGRCWRHLRVKNKACKLLTNDVAVYNRTLYTRAGRVRLDQIFEQKYCHGRQRRGERYRRVLWKNLKKNVEQANSNNKVIVLHSAACQTGEHCYVGTRNAGQTAWHLLWRRLPWELFWKWPVDGSSMQFRKGTEANVVDRLRVAVARYTLLPARTVKKKKGEVC